MKRNAIAELEMRRRALRECYTERRMSLAEGMLEGFWIIGLLTQNECVKWQDRLYEIRKQWLVRREIESQNP
jgi:hypothetical protein